MYTEPVGVDNSETYKFCKLRVQGEYAIKTSQTIKTLYSADHRDKSQ